MIRTKITEKKVQEFLEKNPDYFIKHQNILSKMNFPNNLKTKYETKNVISFKDWLFNSLKQNYRQVLKNAEHNFFTQQTVLNLVIDIIKIKKIDTFKKYVTNKICNSLKLDCFFLISSSKKVEEFGGYFLEKKNLSDIYKKKGELILDAVNETLLQIKNLKKKIISNAIFSLDIEIFDEPSIIVYGSKEKIFLQNRGTDLISFFSNIFQEKLKQFL